MKRLRRAALITLAGANAILAIKAKHIRQEQQEPVRDPFDVENYEARYNH